MNIEEEKQLLTEFQKWFKNKHEYEPFIYAQIILFLTDRANEVGVQPDVMPKIAEGIAKVLLMEVMKCEMKHDENGHAYLKVPSRSLYDLGNQISEFLQSDSNFTA